MSKAPTSSAASAIQKKIIDDAKAEAKQITKNAEKVAKETTETAFKTARANLAGWDARQRQMAQGIGDRVLGKARNDAHMRVLDAKARIINDAFNQARKRFEKERGKAQYKTLLKNLIISAGSQIGGGDIVVLSSKVDHPIIAKLTGINTSIGKVSGNKTKVTTGKKAIDTIGGVLVQNKDGNIAVDYRLETLLKQIEQQQRNAIAQLLFAEEISE